MKFIVEIDELTHSAKVTSPNGEVTVYERCELSQSRELISEPGLPSEGGVNRHTRIFATGKESLSLVMTSEASDSRRREM